MKQSYVHPSNVTYLHTRARPDDRTYRAMVGWTIGMAGFWICVIVAIRFFHG